MSVATVEKISVWTPERSSPDLQAVPGADGETQYRAFSVSTLLDGDLSELNRDHLKTSGIHPASIESKEQLVKCYLAKCGWVVEQRQAESLSSALDLLDLPRIQNFLGDDGERSLLARASDMEVRGWTAMQRELEVDHNVVSSAQTEANPHGYFARTTEGQIIGEHLDAETPDALLLRKMGRTVVTRQAEPSHEDERGLKPVHTHAMAVAEFQDGKWTQTDILPSSDLAFHVTNSTAMQYAQAGFEGCVATINRQGEICLFRIEENAKRFQQTAKAMRMPPIGIGQFVDTMREVVKQNAQYIPQDGFLYIRPSMQGAEGGAGVKPAERVLFTVDVFPFGNYFKRPDEGGILVEGLKSIPRPATGASKVGVNYGSILDVKAGVLERGYNDFLSFNAGGCVEEFSSCSAFFLARDSESGSLKLVTPMVKRDAPEDRASEIKILDSITRRSVIDLARALNISVETRDIPVREVHSFLGAFSTGTAAGLTKISQIDLKENEQDPHPVQVLFDALPQEEEVTALISTLYKTLMAARKGELDGSLAAEFGNWTMKINAERD